MLTSQRKTMIADRLRLDGQLVAKAMAAEWGLSEDTIRRDLREMAAEGLLKRVHGGALPLTPPLPDFSARQEIGTDVKERLGMAAAAAIRPGQMVFLDGGTTTAALVRHLPRTITLTVVTHSPTIACGLEHHENIAVILIGGRLYRHSMVAIGAAAIEAIAGIRFDLYIMGVTAAHPVRGLSTGDMEEAAVKRRIAGNAAETHVLLTVEKLDAVSPFRIMPVEAAARLIIPAGLPEDVLSPYRSLDVEIIEA